MSKWVAENIDKNEKVVSRKPSMSYIYTGREFDGIFSVPSQPVDSLPVVAPDGKSIIIIDIAKGYSIALSPDLQYLVNGSFKLNDNDCNIAGIYFIDNDKISEITNQIAESGFTYSQDAEKFKNSCKTISDKVSVYKPDQLVENLNTRNIKYLILASIRLNPRENTGRIVNTIHNYIAFINMKYPNKFRTVHKIGASESSELVEYLGIP